MDGSMRTAATETLSAATPQPSGREEAGGTEMVTAGQHPAIADEPHAARLAADPWHQAGRTAAGTLPTRWLHSSLPLRRLASTPGRAGVLYAGGRLAAARRATSFLPTAARGARVGNDSVPPYGLLYFTVDRSF